MKLKTKNAEERPIVQTVKLEQPLFVRLKLFGAKTRRSNQDILRAALIEYLNKSKASSLKNADALFERSQGRMRN